MEKTSQKQTSGHLPLVTVSLVVCDIIIVCLAYVLALCLRFECMPGNVSSEYMAPCRTFLPLWALGTVIIYHYFGVYRCMWKFASYNEAFRCVVASIVSIILHCIFISYLFRRMPLAYYVFGGAIQIGLFGISRFGYRVVRQMILQYLKIVNRGDYINAMVIGAGESGHSIVRELNTSATTRYRVRCVIDDDPTMYHRLVENVLIVGGREKIKDAVAHYGINKIFFAIPSASPENRQQILNLCKETNCQIQVLPYVLNASEEKSSLNQMRDVMVDDLLGCTPVRCDEKGIGEFISGKTILVTGGGGSLGSELCKQIAEYSPKKIVVFDIFDDNAYKIYSDLTSKYGKTLDVKVIIGSVRDSTQINKLFCSYRPDIVFHLAAHKNIPLAETSPDEIVKNNVFGTYKLAYAAMAYGCRNFYYMSTDKAVNPKGIMGAASRLCEMLLMALNNFIENGCVGRVFPPNFHNNCWPELPSRPVTSFASLRFGGALDSNGSVFQIFKEQIRHGGPVTVTNKEATRYFMPRENLVKLILQAAILVDPGDIAGSNMDAPVKIDDLARTLIKLSGFTPDKDIKVEYTSLREGEKLHEEPISWKEGLRKTSHDRIVLANKIPLDYDKFFGQFYNLFNVVTDNCTDARPLVAAIVPDYELGENNSGAVPEQAGPLPFWAHEPINNLERTALRFAIEGNVSAIILINKGYINRTYRVETYNEKGQLHKYTMQRINTNVFPDVKALMDNYMLVTSHLEKNFRLPDSRTGMFCNQTVIPTKKGKSYYVDDSGAWRMLSYFDDVHSYDIPDIPETFGYAGEAFGTFIRSVADIPSDKVVEVIPNFHNTYSRYLDLEEAIKNDAFDRVKEVAPEIAFIRSHVDLFRIIADALEKGEIPRRICHNDCNLNNILFDNKTNRPVAIIDLDTVMPSSPLYDFGDSMRVGTNTAKDDEKDLSKVSCNLDLFQRYASGWLKACGSMLTPKELELLPYASLVITSEDGIRFLADYINGDTYYNIFYPGQNLDRARTQLKLLQDMEQKLPQIKEILNKLQ